MIFNSVTSPLAVFYPVIVERVHFLKFGILKRDWHDHRDALSDFGISDHLQSFWIDVSDDVPGSKVFQECTLKLETRVSDEMAESYDLHSHASSSRCP